MSSINNVINNVFFHNALQKISNIETSIAQIEDIANETLDSIKKSIAESKKTLSNYENTIRQINEKSKCPFIRLIDVICRVVLFILKPILYLISLPISYAIFSATSLYYGISNRGQA